MKRIHSEDGADITKGVQILYDIAHSSMDWGSGFLDNEEMATVIGLATRMGWQVPDLPYSTGNTVARDMALRFPDYYSIEEVQHPSSVYHPEPWVSYRVRRVER